MANRYMKKMIFILSIREMSIKTKMKKPSHLLEWLRSHRTKEANMQFQHTGG